MPSKFPLLHLPEFLMRTLAIKEILALRFACLSIPKNAQRKLRSPPLLGNIKALLLTFVFQREGCCVLVY